MSQKEENISSKNLEEEEDQQKDGSKTSSPRKQKLKFPYKYRQQHKPPALSDVEKANREKAGMLILKEKIINILHRI